MTANATPVVHFDNVTLELADGQRIVSELSFDVQAGEILVLLGRSGSGKTTTLKLINALLTPSDGAVIVEEKATNRWEPTRLRRRIGYVIQEVGLFPHFTVAQNIGLVPTLEGWDPARKQERVIELLDLVGLDPSEYAGRYPAELSGGQRQRIGVARALAADPPLLLMDEPFGALDPLTRLELQRELLDLQGRLQKTIVFVTHDVREAMRLATRIALFQDGSLAFLGSSDELLQSPDPEATAFKNALRER
jgi:osmoprotectant transport system ATP-binding protein